MSSLIVIASANGHQLSSAAGRRGDGAPGASPAGETCVERAFSMMTSGADVLEALVAGVTIVELDPADTSVGYGALPNADGIVELDACVMHGPRRRAAGVAALTGVATAAAVAARLMEETNHHLLVGAGAVAFARRCGFDVRQDLNTSKSRALWMEWTRRLEQRRAHGAERVTAGYAIGLEMAREGLIDANHLWGTINCNGVNAAGEVAGVTATSGLAWKMPGRVGDSPILGAGLYVHADVGAAGSTGRGESNLYSLSSFFIVDLMRRGMHPTDAGIEALKQITANTIDPALLNARGEPNFNVKFYIVNRRGEYSGVALYGGDAVRFAVCTEHGAELRPCEALLDGPMLG